jgi:hypothetical protein
MALRIVALKCLARHFLTFPSVVAASAPPKILCELAPNRPGPSASQKIVACDVQRLHILLPAHSEGVLPTLRRALYDFPMDFVI